MHISDLQGKMKLRAVKELSQGHFINWQMSEPLDWPFLCSYIPFPNSKFGFLETGCPWCIWR
jgi:hypothetical protein